MYGFCQMDFVYDFSAKKCDVVYGVVKLKQVIKSINDNITEEVLLQEIKEIIRLPMYADRIRNDSQVARRKQRLYDAYTTVELMKEWFWDT